MNKDERGIEKEEERGEEEKRGSRETERGSRRGKGERGRLVEAVALAVTEKRMKSDGPFGV